MKENEEITTLKRNTQLLYLSHIEEEAIANNKISPTSLFVKKNMFFNTTKYQINGHFKPIIVR